MSVSNFPDDLLTEVLARLPPNSLMRFRCVSKSWHALIDSPKFVQTHLNRARMDLKAHAYVFRAIVGCGYKIYAAKLNSALNFKFTDLLKVNGIANDRICADLGSTSIVGSCNGLLCLDKSLDKLVILWNPWIGKMFEIPYPRVQSKSSGYNRNLERCFYFGFGYDDACDDYKVVRFADHQETVQSPQWCEVKVYSLKLNCWRKLRDFPYPIRDSYSDECAGVLSNCALHWIVEGDSIAAIDLRTEEYKLIPKPEFLKDYYSLALDVLDGCLCLLSKVYNTEMGEFQVQLWLMTDYRRNDSWSKLSVEVLNVRPHKSVRPIGCTTGTKQLFLQQGKNKFLFFDIENQRLPVAAVSSLSALEGYDCVGSIVQPNAGRSKGIKRKRKDAK